VFEESRAVAGQYYRERAREMLKKAKQSHTKAARKQFLALAEHWDRLAQSVNYPTVH
jgi:hypothetical protein